MSVSEEDLANCAGAEEVVRMIGGKWKLLILRQLVYGGVKRFSALKKGTPGITQTMLTKRLRDLEADGLVTRTVYPEIPPRVEYEATSKALDLDQFFRAMHAWGTRNVAN